MEIEENYLDDFVKRGVNVVFTFGNVGTGKTSFIVGMFNYLHSNGTYILNTADIEDAGYKHITTLIDEYRNGKLPESSAKGTFKEIDVFFEPNGKKDGALITFLDLPGETFKEDIRKGILTDKLKAYLTYPGLKSTVLCFMDSSKPEKDDVFIHRFLNILKGIDYDFGNIGLIVTKWDLVTNKFKNLYDFLNYEDKKLQTMYWLKNKVYNPEAFPLSIGKLDPNDSKKIVKHEDKFFKDIHSWLYVQSKIKTPNKMSVLGVIKNAARFLRNSLNFENPFSNET